MRSLRQWLLCGVAWSGAALAQPAAIARGEQVYARCAGCHALAHDSVGPRHCGLLGRRAGRLPGYDFSVAMQRSGIVWDERALDRFLAAPMRVVPETTMTYAGVPDAQDRRDLIAYLRAAGQGAACRPPQAATRRPPSEKPR